MKLLIVDGFSRKDLATAEFVFNATVILLIGVFLSLFC